jgi:hypothetical protein
MREISGRTDSDRERRPALGAPRKRTIFLEFELALALFAIALSSPAILPSLS